MLVCLKFIYSFLRFFFSFSRLYTLHNVFGCAAVIILSMWMVDICDCVSWRCGKCTYIQLKCHQIKSFDNLDRWRGKKMQSKHDTPSSGCYGQQCKQKDREKAQKKAPQMTVYTTGYFEMYSHEAFNLSVWRAVFQWNQKELPFHFECAGRACSYSFVVRVCFFFFFVRSLSLSLSTFVRWKWKCRRRFQSIVT